MYPVIPLSQRQPTGGQQFMRGPGGASLGIDRASNAAALRSQFGDISSDKPWQQPRRDPVTLTPGQFRDAVANRFPLPGPGDFTPSNLFGHRAGGGPNLPAPGPFGSRPPQDPNARRIARQMRLGAMGGNGRGLEGALGGAGRMGDTVVAHLGPREFDMLSQMGGGPTINPVTGLPEFWDAEAGMDHSGSYGGGGGGGVGSDSGDGLGGLSAGDLGISGEADIGFGGIGAGSGSGGGSGSAGESKAGGLGVTGTGLSATGQYGGAMTSSQTAAPGSTLGGTTSQTAVEANNAYSRGLSPEGLGAAGVGLRDTAADFDNMGNSFGDTLGNLAAGQFGFNEIDPTTQDLGSLIGKTRADWGFDPAGMIGGAIGTAVGVPGVGTLTDQFSKMLGRPLEMNMGPDVLGGITGALGGESKAGSGGNVSGGKAGGVTSGGAVGTSGGATGPGGSGANGMPQATLAPALMSALSGAAPAGGATATPQAAAASTTGTTGTTGTAGTGTTTPTTATFDQATYASLNNNGKPGDAQAYLDAAAAAPGAYNADLYAALNKDGKPGDAAAYLQSHPKSGTGGTTTPGTPLTNPTPEAPSWLGLDPNMTDLQRRSYIATMGTQGSGDMTDPSVVDYYINTLKNGLGKGGDEGQLLPVEQQYLEEVLGLNFTPGDNASLLTALQNYKQPGTGAGLPGDTATGQDLWHNSIAGDAAAAGLPKGQLYYGPGLFAAPGAPPPTGA